MDPSETEHCYKLNPHLSSKLELEQQVKSPLRTKTKIQKGKKLLFPLKKCQVKKMELISLHSQGVLNASFTGGGARTGSIFNIQKKGKAFERFNYSMFTVLSNYQVLTQTSSIQLNSGQRK